MEINGEVVHIGQTETVGANGFKKRMFVVKTATNPQYPQELQLEVVKDRCNDLDALNIGEVVACQIDLRGRRWDSPDGPRWFNTLNCWRFDRQGSQTVAQPQQLPQGAPPPAQQQLPGQQPQADGIPF